jgi:hypothetical protein
MNTAFETSDLSLAAFLLADGRILTGVDATDPQRVVFALAPHPDLGVLAAFAGGSAMVNVQRFVAAERHLKRRLWAIRDGREVRP